MDIRCVDEAIRCDIPLPYISIRFPTAEPSGCETAPKPLCRALPSKPLHLINSSRYGSNRTGRFIFGLRWPADIARLRARAMIRKVAAPR